MSEKDTPTSSDADESFGGDCIVCPSCLHGNPLRAVYCDRCGAPIDNLPAFQPFDQTLIEGAAYRRAVDGPPSKIVLAGMWLLFVPGLIVFPLLLVSHFDSSATFSESIIRLVCWGGYFLLSAAILFRSTRNYFAKRSAAALEEGVANNPE